MSARWATGSKATSSPKLGRLEKPQFRTETAYGSREFLHTSLKNCRAIRIISEEVRCIPAFFVKMSGLFWPVLCICEFQGVRAGRPLYAVVGESRRGGMATITSSEKTGPIDPAVCSLPIGGQMAGTIFKARHMVGLMDLYEERPCDWCGMRIKVRFDAIARCCKKCRTKLKESGELLD